MTVLIALSWTVTVVGICAIGGVATAAVLDRVHRAIEIATVNRLRRNRAHMRFMKRHREWMARRGVTV